MRRDVAEHLAACTACRAQLERLRTISGALAELPDLAPPASLGERIGERVRATSQTIDLAGHAAPRRWRGPLAAAVLVGVSLGVYAGISTYLATSEERQLARSTPAAPAPAPQEAAAPVAMQADSETAKRTDGAELAAGMEAEADRFERRDSSRMKGNEVAGKTEPALDDRFGRSADAGEELRAASESKLAAVDEDARDAADDVDRPRRVRLIADPSAEPLPAGSKTILVRLDRYDAASVDALSRHLEQWLAEESPAAGAKTERGWTVGEWSGEGIEPRAALEFSLPRARWEALALHLAPDEPTKSDAESEIAPAAAQRGRAAERPRGEAKAEGDRSGAARGLARETVDVVRVRILLLSRESERKP